MYITIYGLHIVPKYGQCILIKYLRLQDFLFKNTNRNYEFDVYHEIFYSEYQLRFCLVEEKTDDISYTFSEVRIIESTSCKRLREYQEFVRM